MIPRPPATFSFGRLFPAKKERKMDDACIIHALKTRGYTAQQHKKLDRQLFF
jgi:hypothetical protein